MFHHPWAIGNHSSGPLAAGTVKTKSTGGFYQADASPCINVHIFLNTRPGPGRLGRHRAERGQAAQRAEALQGLLGQAEEKSRPAGWQFNG